MRMEREDTTGTRDSSAFQLYAPAAASSLLPTALLNNPPPPDPDTRTEADAQAVASSSTQLRSHRPSGNPQK